MTAVEKLCVKPSHCISQCICYIWNDIVMFVVTVLIIEVMWSHSAADVLAHEARRDNLVKLQSAFSIGT